jgi:hypothetical protein
MVYRYVASYRDLHSRATACVVILLYTYARLERFGTIQEQSRRLNIQEQSITTHFNYGNKVFKTVIKQVYYINLLEPIRHSSVHRSGIEIPERLSNTVDPFIHPSYFSRRFLSSTEKALLNGMIQNQLSIRRRTSWSM